MFQVFVAAVSLTDKDEGCVGFQTMQCQIKVLGFLVVADVAFCSDLYFLSISLAENENFDVVTVLFQAVASTCCIPSPWKCAIVTASHKKGQINDACNYRPISLTRVLCKVFEKLFYRHLYTHMRDNLGPHQHGFVRGKSWLSNLLETVHEINTILEDGEVYAVDLVYLDFQKTFHKVPHERLLLNLKAHGITGNATTLFEILLLVEQWQSV